MTVAAEECRAQVPVKVEDVPSMNLGSSLSDFAFTDVAPKAFLQIRHAAGVSSREYADILGEALAATSVGRTFAVKLCDCVQGAPTCK